MRDWKELLNSDKKKNPQIKNIIDNITEYTIEDIRNFNLKKDITKRLIKLKELNPQGNIILSQKERIEKCISFSYKEDIIGKIYIWDNKEKQFDLTGKNEVYEIFENQPLWINLDKNIIKMDSLFFNSINLNIFNYCSFLKEGNMAEYSNICNKFNNELFETLSGEIINI